MAAIIFFAISWPLEYKKIGLPFLSICVSTVCVKIYYTDRLRNYSADCGQILDDSYKQFDDL